MPCCGADNASQGYDGRIRHRKIEPMAARTKVKADTNSIARHIGCNLDRLGMITTPWIVVSCSTLLFRSLDAFRRCPSRQLVSSR